MFNRVKIEIKEYLKNTLPVKLLLQGRNAIRTAKYYAHYYKLRLGLNSVSDIEIISIEFSSICNLKCQYCYLEKNERPTFLSLDIYIKLLREICKNKKFNIKIMEWPISGCFFLHPQHKEIVTLTREYREKYGNFSPWIILNDNMMLFDAEKVNFILGQGVINQVICSIDGVDKKTFEDMRPGGDFEKALKNTAYLLQKNREHGSRITIQINNGVDESCNNRKIDSRLKDLFNQAEHITRWEPLDWNESFHTDRPIYKPRKHFCSFVFESVTLSSSGAITKCCMDLKEKTKYGDFNKDTLKSIWFSEERRAFLREMYKGNRCLIPGCDTCSISYVSQNKYPQ